MAFYITKVYNQKNGEDFNDHSRNMRRKRKRKKHACEKIEESLNCSVKTIGQDCYYVDHSDMPFTERVHINYDAPHSFDHSALFEDVTSLRDGHPITKKAMTTKHIAAPIPQKL